MDGRGIEEEGSWGGGTYVHTYARMYVSEVMCLGKGVRVVHMYMCQIMLHEAHKSVILYSKKFLREKFHWKNLSV